MLKKILDIDREGLKILFNTDLLLMKMSNVGQL